MSMKLWLGVALISAMAMPAFAQTTRAEIREDQQEARENVRKAHEQAEREARETRRGMPDADPQDTRNYIEPPQRDMRQDYVRQRGDGMND